MSNKYGVFSQTEYVHSQYVQAQGDPHKGLNFKASAGKHGKVRGNLTTSPASPGL
jgi:hypothetical protein